MHVEGCKCGHCPVASRLEPFPAPNAECPKCGAGPGRQPVSLSAFPMPAPSALKLIYCAGGKEPEETTENPLMAFMQTVLSGEAFAQKFRSLPLKRINICAGITEEHLHVGCMNCGHEWLTQTKEQSLRSIPGVA